MPQTPEIDWAALDGPRVIRPARYADARGWFSETWSATAAPFADLGVGFVQDNQSLSRAVGTVRGLHFQRPPCAQAKLVRCLAGRILDYAVDIRRGSPGWGCAHAVELSGEGGEQVFVPVGFAHGFVTLTPDCQIAYKVSAPYAPDQADALAWDDPALGIDWPLPAGGAVVSDKDRTARRLADLDSPFAYDGARG